MNDERFWLLLSRHLAGESSAEEEMELNGYLEQSPEYKVRYDLTLKYWGKNKQRSDTELREAYQKVWTKIKASSDTSARQKVRRISPVLRYSVAAVFFLCLCAYLFSVVNDSSEWTHPSLSSKRNLKGEKSKFLLSDGSIVWLNGDSEIRFPAHFSTDRRDVYLEGEAFFEVAKNPDQPFVIHLHDGVVRVLGTSFNVKAFENDQFVETSVVTGKVAFIPGVESESAVSADTVYLTPNQKVVYNKDLSQVQQLETNSLEDRAWIDGKLVFRSNTFFEVAQVLERTYAKKIIFGEQSLQNCRLTGTFEGNSLEEVMSLLAETKDYEYSISDDEIFITGTGCDPK